MPCMGKVYYRCFQLQQKLAAVEWLEEKEQKWLSDQWEYRWNQLHSDMHACGEQLCAAVCVCSMHKPRNIDVKWLPAGYVCDPEYRKHDVFDIPEVAAGFRRLARKIVPADDYDKLNLELETYRWTAVQCFVHGLSCVFNA